MAYVDTNYPNTYMVSGGYPTYMTGSPNAGCCAVAAPAPACPSLCAPPRQCCKPAQYSTCDGGRRHHMLATAYGQTTDDVAVADYGYQM